MVLVLIVVASSGAHPSLDPLRIPVSDTLVAQQTPRRPGVRGVPGVRRLPQSAVVCRWQWNPWVSVSVNWLQPPPSACRHLVSIRIM